MKTAPKLESDMICPIEYGLTMFGGRWKSRILCVLSSQDAMRYSAIRNELNNITDAVLAAMLKELAADGLIGRRQFDEIPPRVEYALTDKGTSVLPVLQMICHWSREHSGEDLNKKLPSCKTCSQLSDHS